MPRPGVGRALRLPGDDPGNRVEVQVLSSHHFVARCRSGSLSRLARQPRGHSIQCRSMTSTLVLRGSTETVGSRLSQATAIFQATGTESGTTATGVTDDTRRQRRHGNTTWLGLNSRNRSGEGVFPGHRVTANDVRALLGVLGAKQDVSKGIVTTAAEFARRIGEDEYIKPHLPTRLELRGLPELCAWFDRLLDADKGPRSS